jgi:hypothetical protein
MCKKCPGSSKGARWPRCTLYSFRMSSNGSTIHARTGAEAFGGHSPPWPMPCAAPVFSSGFLLVRGLAHSLSSCFRSAFSRVSCGGQDGWQSAHRCMVCPTWFGCICCSRRTQRDLHILEMMYNNECCIKTAAGRSFATEDQAGRSGCRCQASAPCFPTIGCDVCPPLGC